MGIAVWTDIHEKKKEIAFPNKYMENANLYMPIAFLFLYFFVFRKNTFSEAARKSILEKCVLDL